MSSRGCPGADTYDNDKGEQEGVLDTCRSTFILRQTSHMQVSILLALGSSHHPDPAERWCSICSAGG